MPELLTVVRYAVLTVFAVSLLAATGSWLVRTRRVSPFGALGRALRAATDALIRPVETRVLRLGGNPANAGWWLVVVVMVAGVLLISLVGWFAGSLHSLVGALTGGPRALVLFLVNVTYRVLVIALLARVIASWFGMFSYSRWMRPAYWLTDWLVNPLRRLLPPVAVFDLSPLAAWFVLWAMRQFLLGVVL